MVRGILEFMIMDVKIIIGLHFEQLYPAFVHSSYHLGQEAEIEAICTQQTIFLQIRNHDKNTFW